MHWNHCPKCGAAMVDTPHGDPLAVQACSACGQVHYDNPVPVVAVIVETPGGVVLVRNHGWPEKMFGLVTGFIERNEHPEAAALREVAEELSLTATHPQFVGMYPFDQMNQIIIAYAVQADGEIVLNEELVEHKVIPKSKVRPWPFATGLALADWLAR